MLLRRALGWIAWAMAAALVVGPAAALVPAMILDRGADGSVRIGPTGPALVAWDPFVWACARNSLAVAAGVAAGSWAIGVALGRVLGRRRFWGRKPLAILAWTSMAATPPIAAIGLRAILERWGPRSPGLADGLGWLAWIWVGLATGVPTVALATRAGLARVEAAWEDAARAAGASRRQVWSTIAWPLVRPGVGRAVVSVFAATLLEPGAPLVFGLRRTLAFQIVESALGDAESAPRAATLALIGVTIAGLGGMLVRWGRWDAAPNRALAAHPGVRRARWPLAAMAVVVLVGGSALALVPTAGLLAIASTPGAASGGEAVPALIRHLRGDLDAYRIVGRSLAAGLAAGGLGLALAWARGLGGPRGRWARADRAILRLPAAFPPLAVAVGVLMVPRLLAMAGDLLSSGGPAPAGSLHRLASGLDPYGTPGVLLVAALVAIQLPTLARAVDSARPPSPPRYLDAARALGASRGRLVRARLRLGLGSAPGAALLLSSALAATALAPGLVLAPTADGQTLGPVVLERADRPGGGLERASALAVLGWGVNLSALAIASRRRAGPLGDWFRG